jgi:hypothetical protein
MPRPGPALTLGGAAIFKIAIGSCSHRAVTGVVDCLIGKWREDHPAYILRAARPRPTSRLQVGSSVQHTWQARCWSRVSRCRSVRQSPGSWLHFWLQRARAALAARVEAVQIGSAWTNVPGQSLVDCPVRR